MTPAILDLFCGAGGVSCGYTQAGFRCVGVDINPQKNYPYEFHQADALEYLREHGHEFDAIHASPPCQAFSALRTMPNAKKHISLVEPVRELLIKSGKQYVIENVPGAPLINPVMLCGTMFNLGCADGELRRHRLFECSFYVLAPECRHGQVCSQVIGVYGGGGVHSDRPPRQAPGTIGVYGDSAGMSDARKAKRPATVGVWGKAGGFSVRDGVQQYSTSERREAMGIDWMTGKELSHAIPPAYTRFIGEYLLAKLSNENREFAPI